MRNVTVILTIDEEALGLLSADMLVRSACGSLGVAEWLLIPILAGIKEGSDQFLVAKSGEGLVVEPV